MSLSSASISTGNSYSRALSPMVAVSILFGPGERLYSKVHSWLGGFIFIFLLGGMTFVSVLGVFVRSSIDTWIEFSLFIVPLIALIAGSRVYTSSAFNKLLRRKLFRKSMVTSFPEFDQEIPWHETQRASWLRKAALKNCIYPFVLEIYQWTAYAIFRTKFQGDKFPGSWKDSNFMLFEINDMTWHVLYCFFWAMAMYITGFLAYSFILICRLTVRDVVSFMCRFGDSPFLLYRPSVTNQTPVWRKLGFLRRAINGLSGFVSMDFFQTKKDIVLVYEQDVPLLEEIQVSSDPGILEEGNWDAVTPQEFDSFSTESVNFSKSVEGRINVPKRPRITAADASKYLAHVLYSIEALAGLFQPFIVMLLFFSVVSLVIHVGAMVHLVPNFSSSHWWTLLKTGIWFLLSLRLLYSSAEITRTFSNVSQHLTYVWSVGQLHGDKEDWQRFFKLVKSFQLGTKTYGFPLTLKQAASIATFINFALIMVLSIMKPSVHLPTKGN